MVLGINSKFKAMFEARTKEKRELTKEEKAVIEAKSKELKAKEELKKKKLKDEEEKRKIQKLIMDWIEVMAHKGLDNHLDETFSLSNIKCEPYGFSCNINIAKGLSFSMLESQEITHVIEDNLGCLFIAKRKSKSKQMEAKFIMEDIPEIDFEPFSSKDKEKLEPFELYLGTSIDGTPIVASMLRYPHLIVQGATGMGKTKMIDCVCTNLIVQTNPDDLSLYFIQGDKSDQIIYRKCKHTRAYADDIYKALAVTTYLKEVVDSRDKMLRPLIEEGICENIVGFNKVYKKYKQHKFTYIYLIIDEYSSLMPGDSDSKQKKAIKNAIQENMERLIQIGRYVGIYILVGLQRSTIDKLPSFVKSMCNTIATFRVNNTSSSYVAIDSNEAVYLNPRESIIKTNEKVMAKTVTITPQMILNYTKDTRWSNGQYKDFIYDSWLPEEFKGDSKSASSSKIKAYVSKNAKRKAERYEKNTTIDTNKSKTELTDDELEALVSKKSRRI